MQDSESAASRWVASHAAPAFTRPEESCVQIRSIRAPFLPQEMVDLERGTATRLPRATKCSPSGRRSSHGMISNKHDYLSLSDRLVMSDSMRVRDSGLTSAGLLGSRRREELGYGSLRPRGRILSLHAASTIVIFRAAASHALASGLSNALWSTIDIRSGVYLPASPFHRRGDAMLVDRRFFPGLGVRVAVEDEILSIHAKNSRRG